MEDTICAISTSLGIGAISIIRVSGKDSILIVNKIFDHDLSKVNSHTIHYGHIVYQKEVIDEVLVMIMKSPKTYTCEDIVEINTHGGLTTTNKVLEILLKSGARLAEPGEFTKRAFLNGRIDLTEAESVSDLINAKTEASRKMAISGINGKIYKKINTLRDKIVKILANIEVNIDYPEYEDELVITNNLLNTHLKEIKKDMEIIIKDSENGRLINKGIDIAIVGKPNVGKSSLLNTLLDEEKAIVTSIPGTTRDIVEGSITLNGVLVNLKDTAGIRKAKNEVEQIGVLKSKKMIDEADLNILVLNNNEKLGKEDQELLKIIDKKKTIIFVNKNDLAKVIDLEGYNYIIGNTINDDGIDKLKEEIINHFNLKEIINKDMTYLSNLRQIDLIKKAYESIKSVEKGLNNNDPIDLLEIDLKSCWRYLGEITGEVYEDELIDNLFKNFCLGK